MFARISAGLLSLVAFSFLMVVARLAFSDDPSNPVVEWVFESERFSKGLLPSSGGEWNLAVQGDPQWEADTRSAHFSGGMDQATLVLAKGDKGPPLGSEALSLEAWVRLDCGSRKGGLIGRVDDNRYGGNGVSLGYDEDRFRFGLAAKG